MEHKLTAMIASFVLGLIVLIVFWLYNRKKALVDETEPGYINFATWFILAYGDGLDLVSYSFMTSEWWLNAVPFAFAIGSIFTFVFCFATGRFGKVGQLVRFWKWDLRKFRRVDIFCVCTDVLITAGWVYFSNSHITLTITTEAWLRSFDAATVANLAYQVTAIVAFVPMWWSQTKGRELERPLPWLLWAFAFLCFSVLMAYEKGKWEELVYPGVNLFTHFMLGIAALTAVTQKKIRKESVETGLVFKF